MRGGVDKKRKIGPKGIYNYCKEPGLQKKDCPKKEKNDFVVPIVQNDYSFENDLVLAIGEQLQ